jgi:ribonuclease T1
MILVVRRFLFALLLALLALPAAAAMPIEDIALADLPPEAHETLRLIKRGGPYPHKRDGLIFGNYERRLPVKPRGYYLEYTVRTPGARTRGARRIIAGRGAPGDVRRAEYYYTEDHYQTFWRIRE